MANKKIKTEYPGVRYREHATRKHGIMKDRYFFIRYRVGGKLNEEGLGWASKGMTAKKANGMLADLQKNHRTGKGPQTLREEQAIEKAQREAEKQDKARHEKEDISFANYFTQTYFPTIKLHKKQQTYSKEETHFRLWMNKTIGQKPFRDIKPFDLERIKKKLIDAEKSPRTIQYVFATFRQVWNMARRDGIVIGDSPTRSVKLIRFDNKRHRYLTIEEEHALLDDLRRRNSQVHDMTLLALRTGMRASEIFKLKWGHLDLERGQILILDGKGEKGRVAFMTGDIKAMFEGHGNGGRDELVFPSLKGLQHKEISDSFENAIKTLGLNENVSDRRQRVCFHTCRHTFASRLAESGVDLYTIKTLLGHSTISLTERYSHLSEGTLQNAIRTLEQSLNNGQTRRG